MGTNFFAHLTSLGHVLSYSEWNNICHELKYAPLTPKKGGVLASKLIKLFRQVLMVGFS